MISNNPGSDDGQLSGLASGQSGVIEKVGGHGAFRKRITEMGFVKGKTVKVIKNAPLQDPIEYEVMGYNVSLRRNEARLINITPVNGHNIPETTAYPVTFIENIIKKPAPVKDKTIKVALVGNPNSGKTTLFNYASGLHEKVGNYGGVTIDAKEAGINFNGYSINIVDLPGTYSITEYTPEELFVRSHILNEKPDIVINVLDASNLERNLFLTTQLIDMNIKVIIALNMFDELTAKGTVLKYKELGQMTGIPIIPTIAVKGKGINELKQEIIDVFEDKDPFVRSIHINYGSSIEKAIKGLQKLIEEDVEISHYASSRYLALKLLENDRTTLNQLKHLKNYDQIVYKNQTEIQKLEKEYDEKSETIIADAKYGFIAGALKETMIENKEPGLNKKFQIDDIITHKYLGFPVFILFMWIMFQATFTIGSYPMKWINTGVAIIGNIIGNVLPAGALHDLLINGIIAGVGGVIVFLPNILILFFFISLMEDTGYMARVSFIMDRLMHTIGLHGKSFIPLLMGFGCNVPAIMATRTLENRKDRMLTMLIAPFMSCSARLPVYVLLISAFFPKNQGLVLFSIYIIGIIIAVLVAIVLKKTVFSKKEVPFVMELPPYRIPTFRNTTVHMWHKAVQYIQKMGSVILVASILIWSLSYYPRHSKYLAVYDSKIQKAMANTQLSDSVKNAQVFQINLEKEAKRQENTYIGHLGHFIEPAIKPLGFDWKIGLSILSGLAAKEIVISTMGILYQVDVKTEKNAEGLINKLRNQDYQFGINKGHKVFTQLVAFTFMLFVLIYFPCVAVIAAIKKESNWKWAVFTMVYTTAIAWLVSFATYQIGSLIVN